MIILLKTTKSAALMPDGSNAPLAFDATTQKLVVKIADGMPWGDDAKLAEISAVGGQYVADEDDWYRGVWASPVDDVLGAEYTANELRRRAGMPPLVAAPKAIGAPKSEVPNKGHDIQKQPVNAH